MTWRGLSNDKSSLTFSWVGWLSHLRLCRHRVNAHRIHTNIHAFSGIRIHDLSVGAGEDSSCLRPRGHCDRLVANKVYVYNYFSTDGLSALVLVSAPFWVPWAELTFSLVWQILVSSCRAPSLTRGQVCNLYFNHSMVSRRTNNHILLSHLRFLQPGRPGSRIYIPQEQDGPVKPPGTGFPFCRSLRLGGLWWRYSNPPPHMWEPPTIANVMLITRPQSQVCSNTGVTGHKPFCVCVCFPAMDIASYTRRPTSI
jgi:hypothetical protein